MIVIHSVWDNIPTGRLHIWAESSELPMEAARRRGRPSKKPKPQAHPFTVPARSLIDIMDGLARGVTWECAGHGTITIDLPSTNRGPRHSPDLIVQEPVGPVRSTGLAPWQIESVSLDPDLALELLLSLPENPPRGIAFGSSVRFWKEVSKYTLELVARQRFVPTMVEVEVNGSPTFSARWEVVLEGEDRERMTGLAESMPLVCRAMHTTEGRDATPPGGLMSDFVNSTVDAFVRVHTYPRLLLPPRRGRPPRTSPMAEGWIYGLSSDEPVLSGPPTELKGFAGKINSWTGQLGSSRSDRPFRTCFRLDAPDDGDGTWRLGYHLQASEDRSLLVPAEKVWRVRGNVLTLLKTRFENPQERLLEDLGRASRLFPRIEESLNHPRPTGMDLTTDQAYDFLRQAAPVMEQSGFGVLLPPWWSKPTVQVGVKMRLKPPKGKVEGTGLFGLTSIISYDWELALGDETLSIAEFQELAQLKVPLVRVRGQWVELRPEDVERAIAFFKSGGGNDTMGLGEALRIGLGRDDSEMGLPVSEVTGEGWIGDFLKNLSGGARMTRVKTPKRFRGKLRPYQKRGLSWLAYLKRLGMGTCLADDMGLGKTIQVIALLLHEREGGRGRTRMPPVLLVCPMSIVGNWQREVERFAPSLEVMVHHGVDRRSGKDFKSDAKKSDIVITTYALVHRDEEMLSDIDWDCVILDEAQNIKNREAKQTRAISRLRSSSKIALTGTPVENRLSELWSIMEFLNTGYLGSDKEFRRNFAGPIERYGDPDREQTLRRLIGPFVLRRLKSDKKIIRDLPEKMEMKVMCNLTREQATLYEAVVTDMVEKIETSNGMQRRGHIFSALTRLKQVCNHPAQFLQDGSTIPGRSGKLSRIEEMLEEAISEGDKALVFTQFAQMGEILQKRLQETLGREVLFLHGGTPKRHRDDIIKRFQDTPDGPPVFILSIKAGGLGLNLTAANRVFHFDRWWNPAVENQATDRCFRIGQTKNVQVHKFVCIGTIEEHIDEMIRHKTELAGIVSGTGEEWITEMSTDRLRELFAMSREAVGGD